MTCTYPPKKQLFTLKEKFSCTFVKKPNFINENNFLQVLEKNSKQRISYIVPNTNYSEEFFSFCSIFFYSQPAFVFNSQGDSYIAHAHIVAYFVFLLKKNF